VRVGASEPDAQSPDEQARLGQPIKFGEAVALDGIQLTRRGTEVHIILWWRSLAPVEGGPVVFTHLYGAGRELAATADGPPLGGGFPAGIWEPGDRVQDERVLAGLDDAAPPLTIGVGWYDPVTGVRLPAEGPDGAPLPDGEFLMPVSPATD
jgi:hypothetical protein